MLTDSAYHKIGQPDYCVILKNIVKNVLKDACL